MRPLTFINGVLLGSAGALAGAIGMIVFFRWMLVSDPTLDQTVVHSDLPLDELLRDMCIFTGAAVVALAAFWGELKQRPWWMAAEYLLAVVVTGVILFFFADPLRRVAELLFLGMLALLGAGLLGAARRLGILSRVAQWLGD